MVGAAVHHHHHHHRLLLLLLHCCPSVWRHCLLSRGALEMQAHQDSMLDE
jgi:hypothetical protein